MKNLKKLSLVLALTLSVCSLGSCGGKGSDGSDKKSSSAPNYEVNDDNQPVTSKDKTIVIENDDDDEDETEAPTEVPTEAEPDNEDTRLTLGEISDNVYTSKFNGLKITAPEDFKIVNGDALMDIVGAGSAVTGIDDTAMDMVNLVTVYDAAVVNYSTGENVTILYENLARTAADPDSVTPEFYLESSVTASESLGIPVEAGEISTVDIGGKEFHTRKQTIQIAGLSLESDIFVHKIGNYMLCITYSAPASGAGEYADSFRDWFSALD